MMQKGCTKCHRLQSVEQFAASRTNKDGLDYWCRSCRRAYNRERRDLLVKREYDEIPFPERKRCPTCRRVRPSTMFHISRAHLDGLQVNCIDCRRERAAAEYRKRKGEA